MPEESAPRDTPHGPGRQRVISVMTTVFVVLLVTMLVLGAILVLLQIAGLIVVNGGFITEVSAVLSPWTFGVAGVLGIWTLLLSYAHGWKPAD
ncbi:MULTISPECIES: hypothetical protein [unclassified Rathayibacter]|uniref:hypothetical protein n=1 Tax=unclassified Rathayibacter TaxID=2609250 RepID=UPI00188CF6B3|nr:MULTISPECIES: hypothetical protein [unclassified Rathayibacter]MBF4461538.1 hypothetical protein [Rathayibacter sp. VKM Ac-2879]MBF4502949.1 hypothetical protein [Rathayibacter sp. VKM Ac-2878]